MAADYIERESLLEKAWDADTRIGYVQVVDVGDILAEPAADVAPVVHGQWYMLDDCANAGLYCSACGRRVHHEEFAYKKLKSKYCPHCGARMDGGEDRAVS